MKAHRFLAAALAILLFAVLCGCERVALSPLCILHTNDIHGHILPERVAGWKERLGGAAVLAGCIREIRAENREADIPTLTLDAGDIFMGTPEGNVSGGTAVTEIMNAAGYDALSIGNHEFDHGVASLERLAESADFPFLGANTYNSASGLLPPFLRPYLIKDFGTFRVGVIGVVTPETPSIVMPGKTGEILFGEPLRTIRGCMNSLREEGVAFTVVLSHLGMGADEAIAREVEGIGVIIGGHSHTRAEQPLRSPVTGTLICQAESYGKYLGRLDLEIDPSSGRAVTYRYGLIPLTEGRCAPDMVVKGVVEKWSARAGKQFSEVIGYSRDQFVSEDTVETQLGNMVADSMRAATGSQIAFHNSYGIRNPLLRGEITYRDTYKVIPFDNTLFTMTLDGREIREIVEQSLSPRRGLLQVSGIRVVYDTAAPEEGRILAIFCGGEEMDDDRSYRVVTNSYLAGGGDYYETFTRGREVRNTGILDRDAFNDYIRSHSPLSAEGFRPTRLIAR